MAQARLKINTSSATKTAGGDVRGGGLRGANDFEDSPPLMPIASEADMTILWAREDNKHQPDVWSAKQLVHNIIKAAEMY
ncbi:hypothetical protein BASA62_008566 [Batrachochytrium salamandrivorans]|nr:hypothetical protein BASA62_008566 [Batrachochytrium salamandrivorans]